MNPVEQALDTSSLWNSHGLPGLVIFALFGLLFWMIYHAAKVYRETRVEHKDERTEWRQSEERRSDKLEFALSKLTDALKGRKIE